METILFETAKLAKEKGFDLPVFECYVEHAGLEEISEEWDVTELDEETDAIILPDLIGHNFNDGSVDDFLHKHYSKPTHDQLQTWLRDEHGLHIGVGISENGWMTQVYYIKVQKQSETQEFDNFSYGTSYEDALETGLQKALTLL